VLIVGPGAIARKHVAGFRAAGADVVGVAGRDLGRAQAFASEVGVEHGFEGHMAGLEALRPDIVSVATPPASHAAITIDALRAGAHVLCEKPFAMTAAEADAMVAAADESGRLLGCWSSRHQFLWGLSQAIRLAHAGDLGRVVHVHVDWQWRDLVPGLSYQPECPWFLDSAWNGGGVLADWGSYWIDMVLALLPEGDRPVSVLGHTFLGMDARSVDTPRDAEELAMAMVTFESGASAVLQLAARVHQDTNHRMRVWGTGGGVSFNPFDTGADAAYTMYDMAEGTSVARAPGPLSMHDGPPADFVAAVRDGRPPAAPGARAARVVGITEAIYQSARDRRAVNL
jgi:predicted dehydrogenase